METRPVRKDYLPNYLFGSNSPETQKIYNPNKTVNASFSSPKNRTIKFAPDTFEPKNQAYPKTPPSSYFLKNKPPVKEMMDEDMQDSFELPNQSKTFLSNNTQNFSINPEQTINYPYSFYEGQNQFWIRVFGFPNSATNLIIAIFSEYGDIIEHKFASECGNWIDLRYASKLEACQALRQNGRLIESNDLSQNCLTVMIGVMPIKLSSITNVNEEKFVTPGRVNYNMTPNSKQVSGTINYNVNNRLNVQNITALSNRNQARAALQRSLNQRKVFTIDEGEYLSLVSYFISFIPGLAWIIKLIQHLTESIAN